MATYDDIIVKRGALSLIAAVFSRHWPGRTPLIVADRNTWLAAGEVVADRFQEHGIHTEQLVFDEQQLHPDYDHVKQVKERLDAVGALIAIAVGSGSLNDVVKLASYEAGRTYCCVPTAPSVDGYTSANAPITIDSFKQTIVCAPPLIVVADVDVLKDAPLWLISSGYGDLVAKVAGGGDWIIADALSIEKIDQDVWNLVQGPLRERISHPQSIIAREHAVIDQLFSGLVETGLAMKLFGNSRPASGGEHLLSHVWEMKGLAVEGKEVSHGFKVALGTLITTAMMTLVRELSWESVQEISLNTDLHDDWQGELGRLLGEPLESDVLSLAKAKQLDGEHLQIRRDLIAKQWKEIGDRLEGQLIAFTELHSMLADAKCPTEPAEIGLDRETMAYAMRKARVIRPRYTIFDLAYECGILEYMIKEVVYSNRFFNNFLER
jgi:glycerol-1-phosphate dehydrogenase [NAD(P)+]